MYLAGILIGKAGTIDAVALFFDRSTLFTKRIEQAALALTKRVKAGLNEACLANPSCVLMAVAAAQQQNNCDCSASTPTIVRDLMDGEKAELALEHQRAGSRRKIVISMANNILSFLNKMDVMIVSCNLAFLVE